jgi:hypothetical protein
VTEPGTQPGGVAPPTPIGRWGADGRLNESAVRQSSAIVDELDRHQPVERNVYLLAVDLEIQRS